MLDGREDWHVPPEEPAGPCKVVYVYDPRVALPRGQVTEPEDEEPFYGLPRMPDVACGITDNNCGPSGMQGLFEMLGAGPAAAAAGSLDDD